MFRPSGTELTGITRQLVSAGFDHADIPKQWLEVIVAGALKYYTNSREGLSAMAHRLRLEGYSGNSDNIYDVVTDEEDRVNTVDPDDIVFVRGVFAGGRPIFFKQLGISDKERKQCEDCGILGHCLIDVREPKSDRLISLCNSCVAQHESPRINDLASLKTCEGCTSVGCVHHPKKIKTRA